MNPRPLLALAFSLLIATLTFPVTSGAAPAVGAETSAKRTMLRVVVLGLPGHGRPQVTAARIAYPGGPSYRRFLTQEEFRRQFGASPKARAKVMTLRRKKGVRRVVMNASGTVAFAVMSPAAAKRLFCAGQKLPGRPCRPKGYRWAIRQVSLGEAFEAGPAPKPDVSSVSGTGTPEGCSGAIESGALTPNQLATAYEVDELHARGLDGSGIRVNTLSSNVVGTKDFRTWAKCFGKPVPKVTQFAMPGGVVTTQDDPDETILDVGTGDARSRPRPDHAHIRPAGSELQQLLHPLHARLAGRLQTGRPPSRPPLDQRRGLRVQVHEGREVSEQPVARGGGSGRHHRPLGLRRPRLPGLRDERARHLLPREPALHDRCRRHEPRAGRGEPDRLPARLVHLRDRAPAGGRLRGRPQPLLGPSRLSGGPRHNAFDPEGQADATRPRRRGDGLVQAWHLRRSAGHRRLGRRRRNERRHPADGCHGRPRPPAGEAGRPSRARPDHPPCSTASPTAPSTATCSATW